MNDKSMVDGYQFLGVLDHEYESKESMFNMERKLKPASRKVIKVKNISGLTSFTFIMDMNVLSV